MGGILTWLRYTLFIVLYPMGVTGEIGTLHHAATTAAQDDSMSVLHYLQKFYQHAGGLPILILIYVIGLSGLYTHMLAQRAKILGAKKPAPATGDKKNN